MSHEVGDIVDIIDNRSMSEHFTGKIMYINYELVIPRAPQYGQEIKYFIKFDAKLYKSLLLKGWQIYCYISKVITRCVITFIDNSKIEVEEYDPSIGSLPYRVQHKITYEDIDSILIYMKGFSITKHNKT